VTPETGGGGGRALGMRAVEIGTACVFGGLALLAIWDSLRLGAGWGADGPRSGYFPFWLGVILLLASAGNLALAIRSRPRGRDAIFLTGEQARTVMRVFIPTCVYVAAILVIGIYLPSALLVAWFMTRMGGFGIPVSLASGLAASIITFVIFELWFLVALPKGPIETWLGF
jgi:putative tricarboxylic transport membrane protein